MVLSEETKKLLDLIENGIDPETEDDYIRQWEDFNAGKVKEGVFKPERKKVLETDYDFKANYVFMNDALDDYEKMFVKEMQGVLKALCSKRGNLCVRANYGTGIMSSLFNAPIFIMPYEMDTLPTTKPLSVDDVDELLSNGVPDIYNGFGEKVFKMGEFYKEVFSSYPKIQKYVTVYHPDCQGALDICELLLGSEMFYFMYDEPEKMKDLLTLVTKTYKAFMDHWFTIIPKKEGLNVHWGNIMHKGVITLRDDSAMNLSPEFYEEFALPYDSELLEYYGGGIVHFCGRGDHYIAKLTSIPYLYGINMSQPHLNDMEKIFSATVDKGVFIYGYPEKYIEYVDSHEGGGKGRISL